MELFYGVPFGRLESTHLATSSYVGNRALLIYLAIKKDMEPALLLPMGFGAILVNLPLSPVVNTDSEHMGIISSLFKVGIEVSEAMPLLLFIGIGCMIDFGPLLTNPKLFILGGARRRKNGHQGRYV